MQAALDLVQAELQASTHGADAELQPLREQLAQVLDLRLSVEADDVQVDPVAGFQVGGGEQMGHQLFDIDPVRTRDDDDAGRVLVVRLVAQVGHHRQLLGLHLPGDLFQHLGTGHLVRQGVDDDVAVLDAVHRAHAHRTAAGLVDLLQVGARGDDLGFGGEVRARHVFAQFGDRRARLVEQAHAGRRDFPQVVRRHVGGHAHRDAGGAVEQQVGQAGRLVEGAVEVRYPVHGTLAQFAEQHLGIARQARLGITHGGEGLGIVRRPPVALAVHQRIAIGERLRHQHHGLVAGRVAVRVELAEHVADGARRLLVLGIGIQPQFAHGVDDASLHRLQAVADMRQGAVHDHVHGIIQIGLLGELGQRPAFDPFQAQIEGFAHAYLTEKCFGAAPGCRRAG